MQRWLGIVRGQPDNSDAVYVACKWIQPTTKEEFMSLVGVEIDPKALEEGWLDYQNVKKRGCLPSVG